MVEPLISNLVSNFADKSDENDYVNYFAMIQSSDFDKSWIKVVGNFLFFVVFITANVE